MSEGNPMACKRPVSRSTLGLISESVVMFIGISFLVKIIGMFFDDVFGVNQLYVFLLVGLYGSLQATYLKFRVWLNPEYKSKYCNCVGAESEQNDKMSNVMNGIMTVLDHNKGSLLFNIPNSVFGIFFYVLLIGITYYQFSWAHLVTETLIWISCVGSLFLWYTMVFEVRSICMLCVSIYAANFNTVMYLMD